MSLKKIILTTPPLGKVVEPLYDNPSFVRVSIAYLAGYLRESNDYNIKCIDAKFQGKKLEALISEIEKFNPDIIGISAYTYEMPETKKLAKRLKKVSPKTLIVLGGSHITAIPRETMKEIPEIDVGIIGEGEKAFLKVCENFYNKRKFLNIPGVILKGEKGKFKLNERGEFFDLKKTCVPAWDLFPPAKEYFVQTSRGCPNTCNFCLNPGGRKVRYRTVESVMEEILFILEKFNPERLSFGDEAFAMNKDFAIKLLDEMIYHNISQKTKWDIQTHVRFLDDDILLKMKKAGVEKIDLGVESGNEKILKGIGKGIDKNIVRKVFKKVKKHKIKTGAFFIFGHPNETKKTIWDTIKFAGEINPTEPIFAIMVPFPGTKVEEYVRKKEKGYVESSENWGDYRKQINKAVKISGISRKKMQFYLIFANIYVFVRNFRFLELFAFAFYYRKSVLSFLKNSF